MGALTSAVARPASRSVQSAINAMRWGSWAGFPNLGLPTSEQDNATTNRTHTVDSVIAVNDGSRARLFQAAEVIKTSSGIRVSSPALSNVGKTLDINPALTSIHAKTGNISITRTSTATQALPVAPSDVARLTQSLYSGLLEVTTTQTDVNWNLNYYYMPDSTYVDDENIYVTTYVKYLSGSGIFELRNRMKQSSNHRTGIFFDLINGVVAGSRAYGSGSAVPYESFITPMADGWFHVGYVTTAGAGTSGIRMEMRLPNGITAPFAKKSDFTAGDSVYIWGGQIAPASASPDDANRAYPPVILSDSGTRPHSSSGEVLEDNLNTSTDTHAWQMAQTGGMTLEFIPDETYVAGDLNTYRIFTMGLGGQDPFLTVEDTATGSLVTAYDGTVFISATALHRAAGRPIKIVIVYDAATQNAFQISADGGRTFTEAVYDGSLPSDYGFPPLKIANKSDLSDPLRGYVKNLKTYSAMNTSISDWIVYNRGL